MLLINNNYGFLHTNKFIKNKIQVYKSEKILQNEVKNTFMNETKSEFYYFGSFPRLDYPNDKGQLTWYPIGFSNDFTKNQQKS